MIGSLSVAELRSNEYSTGQLLALFKGANWLCVPSIGIYLRTLNINLCKGYKSHCVQQSTIAKTLNFPAGSTLKPNLPRLFSDSLRDSDRYLAGIWSPTFITDARIESYFIYEATLIKGCQTSFEVISLYALTIIDHGCEEKLASPPELGELLKIGKKVWCRAKICSLFCIVLREKNRLIKFSSRMSGIQLVFAGPLSVIEPNFGLTGIRSTLYKLNKVK